MAGLLRKDFYSIFLYLRVYLLLIVGFFLVSFFSDYDYFLIYPCINVSMLTASVCSLDEQERWNVYNQTLPVSRADYVSAKYLLNLLLTATVTALAAVTLRLQAAFNGSVLTTLFSVSLLPSAILIPLILRFGAEKARIINFFFVFAMVGILVFFTYQPDRFSRLLSLRAVTAIVALAAAALYGFSWFLSVRLYRKREL